MKALHEMTATYWADRSHKKHNRQPLILMAAPKPAEPQDLDEADQINLANPLCHQPFDDERLFS